MNTLIKASAGILIATILSLVLNKNAKEFAILIAIATCCMIGLAVVAYIKPVFAFIEKLTSIGNINNDMIKILFKAVGVSLLAEFTSTLCSDSGNAAMGRFLQILASTVILWLSIPLFNNLIDLINELLVKV